MSLRAMPWLPLRHMYVGKYVRSYSCLVKTFEQSWSLKMDKRRETKLKTKVSKRKSLSDQNATRGKEISF